MLRIEQHINVEKITPHCLALHMCAHQTSPYIFPEIFSNEEGEKKHCSYTLLPRSPKFLLKKKSPFFFSFSFVSFVRLSCCSVVFVLVGTHTHAGQNSGTRAEG